MFGLLENLPIPILWTVIVVMFSLVYNYMTKETWRKLPPGPPALPLVGSLPFLGFTTDFKKPFRKMAAKYGSVFTIYLGSMRVVVLNGYDIIKEAFVQHGDVFAGRPQVFYNKELTKGHGLVFSQGHLWKEQRHYTIHSLREMGMGKSSMDPRITEEIQRLLDEFDKQTGVPYQPQPLLYKAVANVLFATITGKRRDYHDPDFTTFIDTIDLSRELVENTGITEVFPFLSYLPGDPFRLKELTRRYDEMFSMYRDIIDTHRLLLGQDDEMDDFITPYLKRMQEERDSENTTFTDTQLLMAVHELMGAGLETSSTTLGWAVIYMTIHQDIQSRIHTEIDDIIDNDEMPIYELRHRMPYTMACISETQRLANVIPTAIAHCTTDDINFAGYLIPKGTTVLPNLDSVLLDPKTWSHPEKFHPEHFLDRDGNFQTRDELIPFSIGKRMCIGENLARNVLFLFFVALMRRYKFCLAPGHPAPEMEGKPGLILAPKPYHILLERRD